MKTKTTLLSLLLVLIGLNTTKAQVGIGTTSPDNSAVLELQSTTKGFLPPRMDTDARNNINSPAEGLTIYNTDINCVQFFEGSLWFDLCEGGLTAGAPSDCDNVPFLSAEDTQIIEVTNPVTNQTWMDRNLGAFTADRSAPGPAGGTDCWAYGNLYQWGRAADGHEDRTSTLYTDVETGSDGVANFNASGNAWDGEFITRDSDDNNWVDPSVSGVDNLWQGVNGTNNPCPAGYRVPTEAEWEAEWDSWDGTLDNSVPPSSSKNNREGAITSPLKLPVAGYRFPSTGGLLNVGSFGHYWSSTVSGTDARRLFFTSSNANMNANTRAYGSSVRCLKD